MAHLRPGLPEFLYAVAQQLDRILDLPEFAVGILFQQWFDVWPEGHGRTAGRLDKANQVRRDGDANFVPSALQLQADGGTRLDIAASPVDGQSKFHRRNPTFRLACAQT